MLYRQSTSNFEGSEILERYQMQRPQRQSCLPADAVLDEIPAHLPGCANEAELLRSAAKQHMGSDVSRCAAFLAGRERPKETDNAPARRPYTSDFMKRQVEALSRIGMFEKIANRKKLRVKAKCGLFAVEKAGKFNELNQQLARVIFDARDANGKLRAFEVQLIIFTLLTLLEAMYMFMCGFAYSVDMRHYYYQWKLPIALQLFFVVFGAGDTAYLPKVLAMGYRDACVLAQAASWIIVFREPSWVVDKKRERPHPAYRPAQQVYGEDLGIARSIVEASSMPAMVWLRDSSGARIGAIFVLLDGIFVLSRDEALRAAWRVRIEQNLRELSILAKPPDLASGDGSAGCSTIEFAGVVLEMGPNGGIRPKKANVSSPQQIRSHRDGARLAGELVWILRVRRAPAADFRIVLQFARLVGLFQPNTSACGGVEPRGIPSWDQPLVFTAECVAELQTICSRYVHDRIEPPRTWEREPAQLRLYAVTDANLEKCAFVIFDWDLRGQGSRGILHEEASGARRRFDGQQDDGYQCWAEGWAVTDLLAYVSRRWPDTRVQLMVVVDANPVMAAFNKGYSSSGMLTDLLEQRNRYPLIDLVVGRVPGEGNLADLPSRNKSVKLYLERKDDDAQRRLARTVEALAALSATLS